MSGQPTLAISDKIIQEAYRVLKAVGEKADSGEKQQLIEEDKMVELYITYDLEGEKKSTPCIVELQHSLFDAEDGDNAILLTTNKDSTTKEYLSEHPIPGLTKVTSMDKIRTTFATYEQQRNLLHSYKRFLCDESILPMMGSILGCKSFQWNKKPFPVSLKKTDSLEKNIKKALSSTMYLVNCGTVLSIKIGKLSFTEDQILENTRCVLFSLFKKIASKNILTMAFKMTNTMMIPFYEKPAEELLEEVNQESKVIEDLDQEESKPVQNLGKESKPIEDIVEESKSKKVSIEETVKPTQSKKKSTEKKEKVEKKSKKADKKKK